MNTKKLKELTMLTQLMSGFQQPQLQQEELNQRRERSLLEQALGLEQLRQQKELAEGRMAVDREQVGVARDANSRRGIDSILSALPYMANNPQMAEAMQIWLANQDPEGFGAALTQQKQAEHGRKVEGVNSQLGTIYSTHRNDPRNLNKAIEALRLTTPDQSVFNDADWMRFNSSLPAGGPAEVPMPEGGPVTEQIFPLPNERTRDPENEELLKKLFSPKPQQTQPERRGAAAVSYGPDPGPEFNAFMDNKVIPGVASVGRTIQYHEPLAYLSRWLASGIADDAAGAETIKRFLNAIGGERQ